MPANADKVLMLVSPFIIVAGALLTFIGIPFSDGLIFSDFNIGILYIIAMSSVGVIGVILAGWSSNNKWSLYGAMRSAAQIISYEIPIGLNLLLIVIVCGSLQISDIVQWQADNRWFIFHSPFSFIAFFSCFLWACYVRVLWRVFVLGKWRLAVLFQVCVENVKKCFLLF